MNRTDRFVLTSVLVALLVNLGSTFLDRYFAGASFLAASLLGVALIVWGTYRLASVLLQYLRFGRYAVLVYFLNKDYELLLIRHPFHECLLPPGGRLSQWELPHLAVARKLEEETGITDFEFHPQFHNPDLMLSEVVENVPRPYSVHMEHRRQRGGVRFHYAFVYVCRFRGQDQPLGFIEGYHPRWVCLEEIYQMPKGILPFDDVVRRYEDILRHLGRDAPTAGSLALTQ